MTEPTLGGAGGDGQQTLGQGGAQGIVGAGGRAAQVGFGLASGFLDGVHVRAVARQEQEEGAPAATLLRLELLWADAAYTGTFPRWLEAARGWRVEVPRHRDRQAWRYGLEERPPRGAFQVLPRGWVVERTFAWLSQCRRLSKDYERLPATSENLIYTATSRLMLRRLTGVQTPMKTVSSLVHHHPL